MQQLKAHAQAADPPLVDRQKVSIHDESNTYEGGSQDLEEVVIHLHSSELVLSSSFIHLGRDQSVRGRRCQHRHA